MPFRIFCLLVLLVVGASAPTSYFVSHSIRIVMVTTMGAWLLLQVAYFASMLFLIWRSSRAQSGRQRAKRSIIARKDAISRKRIMRATNECSDALQPGQTLRVSALPWVAFHYYLSAQDKTPLPCLRLPRGTPG